MTQSPKTTNRPAHRVFEVTNTEALQNKLNEHRGYKPILTTFNSESRSIWVIVEDTMPHGPEHLPLSPA